MENKNELRQLELQAALLGLWEIENKKFSYFFFPERLDIIIGGRLPVETTYHVFISGEDFNPYLIISNDKHPSGKVEVKKYKIIEIVLEKGILRLLNDMNVEMNFKKTNSL